MKPNQLQKANSQLIETTRTTVQQHVGPIPAPSELELYNKIVPGAAQRIMDWAEEESKHRRQLESLELSAKIGMAKDGMQQQRLGLWFALIIALTTILAGAYCALSGSQIAGSIIGASGVTGLVGVFIAGPRHTPKSTPSQNPAVVKK